MCWWPQTPETEGGTPASSRWEEDGDTTLVTASFPHTPANRNPTHDPAMETVIEPRAFEVQGAFKNTPSTPQRSRPGSSGKILELTPLWEQVLRYNRLPQNVEKVKVFAELALRLSDPEWEVRQHALRVLVDVIRVIPESNNDLDGLMIPVVLTEVTYNLSHPAPAVRKSALDVLSTYIKRSSDPEFVVRSVVSQGLESPATNSNLSLNVLNCIPTLLQDLHDSLADRDQTISHQSLVQVVTGLSKRMVQSAFQHKAINAMVKLRHLVGENRYDHFLESYYPQIKRDFEVLCRVYEVQSNNSTVGDSGIDVKQDNVKLDSFNEHEDDDWSDNEAPLHRSSNVTSSTSTTERSRFELSNEVLEKLESNSRLFSRADTDSNADSEEKREAEVIDDEDYAQSDSDLSIREDFSEDDQDNGNKSNTVLSEKGDNIDKAFGEVTQNKKQSSEVAVDPDRVVMETEIKFDSETAITMTILEEKEKKERSENQASGSTSKDSDDHNERFMNDFVMHLVEESGAGVKRTPRRVRFGGEVVKLRTPDSDVTIEIHEEIDGKETPILKIDTKSDASPKRTPIVTKKINIETSPRESPKSSKKVVGSGSTKESPKYVKVKKSNKAQLSVSGTETKLNERVDKVLRYRRPRPSHIPIPIVPARSRPEVPWKKKLQQPTEDEGSPIPNNDGGESLTSGSEGEQPPPKSGFRNIRIAHEADEWQRLGFIDQPQLENLVKKDDWRARVRALDKLAASLRQPEVARFITVSSKLAGLSLLVFLLKTLHDDRSQRVACSSLRAVRALILAIPLADLMHELPAIVPGICRHLGGVASVSVKLEAVEAMKTLMRTVRPQPVMEVLFSDKCLRSKSSRLRENALLCLMYALMTFPSTEFQMTSLAQRVMAVAVHEPRRRVRQSVLEALAALAQFLPVSSLRLDERNFAPSELDDVDFFTSALHTRLMRKVLPTVSQEGLILYGLQIPADRDGFSSNQNRESTIESSSAPSYSLESITTNGGELTCEVDGVSEADVEWVMAGTGVLSSGSARSRTQLNNAQRGFFSPTDNTTNKAQHWDDGPILISGTPVNRLKGSSSEESKDSVNEAKQPHQSSVNMRPLYMKLQNDINENTHGKPYRQDHGFPKLNTNYNSQFYAENLNQTWPMQQGKLSSRKLAILEPLDHTYQYGLFRTYDNDSVLPPHPHVSINPSNLPPLDWRQQPLRWVQENQLDAQPIQDSQKYNRWSRRQEEVYRRQDAGSREGLKSVLARQSRYSAGNGRVPDSPQLPAERFISPVPPPLRETSPLAPLTPPTLQLQSQDKQPTSPLVPPDQPLHVEDLSGDNTSEELRAPSDLKEEDAIVLDHVDSLSIPEERLNTPPPAPASPHRSAVPVIQTEAEPTQPEHFKETLNISPERRKFGKNTGKPRLKADRESSKDRGPVVVGQEVEPFHNPKEALSHCLMQLEHTDWEKTIEGLQSLIRLAYHHSTLLSPVLHQIVISVTKNVRNLRSQVARVACRSAMFLFSSLGRGIEQVRDLEELCAALLNRTADTNKFLRGDCNSALDTMLDNLSSSKSVAFLVNKGAKHQNAVVRATTCRLLLRLCSRLGPDRVLSLPRETRDAILNTGARSLTEGSLDTRRYAKEMFVLLGQDSRLDGVLTAVVPATVMRSISKILARLTSKC